MSVAEEVGKKSIKLFDNITSEPSLSNEVGIITRLNREWIMMDTKYFPCKAIEILADIAGMEVASDCVFRFGKECGKEMYKRYEKVGKKWEDALKVTAAGSNYFGWGPCEITQLTPEGGIAKVYNSFEARSYLQNNSKKSKKPVCHFFRGIMVGLFELYSGKKGNAEEIKCLGMGDEYCEVIISRREY